MTNVVIVIRNGTIESIYTRNKNICCEILDMDVEDDEAELKRNERRLSSIQNSKTYQEIY